MMMLSSNKKSKNNEKQRPKSAIIGKAPTQEPLSQMKIIENYDE